LKDGDCHWYRQAFFHGFSCVSKCCVNSCIQFDACFFICSKAGLKSTIVNLSRKPFEATRRPSQIPAELSNFRRIAQQKNVYLTRQSIDWKAPKQRTGEEVCGTARVHVGLSRSDGHAWNDRTRQPFCLSVSLPEQNFPKKVQEGCK
jgi:hypothetical protein